MRRAIICTDASRPGRAGPRAFAPSARSIAITTLFLLPWCADRVTQAAPAPAVGAAGSPGAAKLGQAFARYRAGEFAQAASLAGDAERLGVENRDYALYVRAQSLSLLGQPDAALPLFGQLAGYGGSRFQRTAAWRAADCRFELGDGPGAQSGYERLLKDNGGGDEALALFRVGKTLVWQKQAAQAVPYFRRVVLEYPAHPLAQDAHQELSARGRGALSAQDRIARAERFVGFLLWREALRELDFIGDDQPASVKYLRDFWLGETLFKMRRRYAYAGELLLRIHEHIDPSLGPRALFHGARALSRAQRDSEAIVHYHQVVKKYPRTRWADEAQFLSGWLEYNRGAFAESLPDLELHTRLYPHSPFSAGARWFVAFSHYLLGHYDTALPLLDALAQERGELEGGKGQYWKASTLDKLGRAAEAKREWRTLVERFPLSWYSILARVRLAERGVTVGPFGDRPRTPTRVDDLGVLDARALADPLLARVDELVAAGLFEEGSFELAAQERAFLRTYGRNRALPVLLNRYRAVKNFNRPWLLAIVRGGVWLDTPPSPPTEPDHKSARAPQELVRLWWENAYPLAYREQVEAVAPLGKNPPYYLYAIMRKETGFDPHVVSYANAIGLMQMIPSTTRRVAARLGLAYTEDFLFDPDKNLQVASFYIGHLAQKFKGQIPLAAGSYNAGPRAMMRWVDRNGKRPLDEFVELITYAQTREYAKKVTGSYARYLYLYEGKDYVPSLTVDENYVRDEIDY